MSRRRGVAVVLLVVPLGLAALIAVEAFLARQQEGVPFTPPSQAPVEYGTGAPIEYVVLGDSTAAGQGGEYDRGVAASTARHLARRGRVRLVNLAVSGSTAEDVLRDQSERAARIAPDVVLVAVGANDTTHLRRPARVRTDLEDVIDRLTAANCEVAIVLTGSPDLGGARVAAQPLRALLGLLAARMNRRAIEPLAGRPEVTFAPIGRETGPRFREDASLFASDGFHPSTAGYATWVPVLERALDEALAESARPCRPDGGSAL